MEPKSCRTGTVVVCAWTEERWHQLLRAVSSAHDQVPPPLEVVVVVDHNEQLLARAKATFSRSVVVPNAHERGLAGARNTGVERASGEIVLFLDDDAVAEPGWLTRHLSHYDGVHVVGVGGHVEPNWLETRPAWFPDEFGWVLGCAWRGQPASVQPVRNPVGANMSFRRAAIVSAGGFRAGLGRVGAGGQGAEETELSIRIARLSGGHVLHDPRARVRHDVPGDRTSWTYFRSRCLAEGRSKAQMVAGTGPALGTERTYVRRTLPAGVARELVRSVSGREPAGVSRAGAMVAGLTYTTVGYLRGRMTGAEGEPVASPEDVATLEAPVLLAEVDVATGSVLTTGPGVGDHRSARLLLRQDGQPVGSTDVRLGPDGLTSDVVARALSRASYAVAPVATRTLPAPVQGWPDVAVVVATRDRPDQLRCCLESVLATQYPRLSVVVVDSAPSSEETRDLVAREFPTVTYVRAERPGLGLAHNRALQEVVAPFVAFTDDDVVVDPDWLTWLVAALADDQRVACATGLIWPAELETAAQVAVEAHGGFGKGFAPRLFDLEEHLPVDPFFPYSTGVVGSGANMAFRTDVLRRLGGFDSALGAGTKARGGDDLAAFTDVVLAGHTIAYEPAAVVYHRHRRDHEDVERQAHYYGVGLTAHLTRVALNQPRSLSAMVRRSSSAVRRVRGRPGNRLPRRLVWLQVWGMLRGPGAYLASRRSVRHGGVG